MDVVGTSVRIIQSSPEDGDPASGTPIVELTVVMPRGFDETDTDENEYMFVLTTERALALGHQLTSVPRRTCPGTAARFDLAASG